MAGETIITVVGNLTADPESVRLATARPWPASRLPPLRAPGTVIRASLKMVRSLFMRCSAWRDMAEHCAQSLSKGMRVIAQGRLQQRSYQAQDGSQRTVIEMQVDEIGPSLRYATAQVTRQSSSGNGGFSGNRGGYNNANNNGGFGGNNGGYQGGSSYAGGAGYQGGASAPVNAAPAQSAPASDPWSSSDNSGSSFGSFGASQSFGGSSEFGGDSDEPEF